MHFPQNKLLLTALFFLCVLSSICHSNDLLIRQKLVDLTSKQLTNQIELDLFLNNHKEFYISITSPTVGNKGDKQFFFMRPISGKGDKRQVKLALDLPYEQLTSGSPYQINTGNSVKNEHKGRLVTDSYSSCPNSTNTNRKRICKPLSFLVIDIDSEPGTVYGADLLIELRTKNGYLVASETVYVTYTNLASPIGIYTSKNKLSLTARNTYRDSTPLCVFSRSAKGFDTILEGQQHNGRFVLTGRGNPSLHLPYDAYISLNQPDHFEKIAPWEWVSGGIPINTKNVIGCKGRSNLNVQVHIKNSDVSKTLSGIYEGVLTVRVRAI